MTDQPPRVASRWKPLAARAEGEPSSPARGEPEHQWIECSVRVPGTAGEIEVQSLAKVRCDDVVDALDLPRWAAVAFQHLWRSAKRTSQRDLGLALWYLKRATSGHQADARTVAHLLRRLVEISDCTSTPMREIAVRFAQDAEVGEFSALELIHESATKVSGSG